MSKTQDQGNEPKRWLDNPVNVRRIINGFYFLCVLILVIDLIFSLGWHKHAAFAEELSLHSVETLPAFYGLYGFLACVGIAYVSKWMRDWKGKKILILAIVYIK